MVIRWPGARSRGTGIGGLASPPVLLRRHVGHVAEISPLRLFAVTIAGLRSSLAGAGVVSGFAAPFPTMAGPASGAGFRFRGGRL